MEHLNQIKPRLGLIISPNGIESITLVGEGSEETAAANRFCSTLEPVLKIFESLIQEKVSEIRELQRLSTQ